MTSKILLLATATLILAACVVAPVPGGGMSIVPILPTVVEVDMDNHYAYGGYHYFYNDSRWYYADSRGGQRSELPRSHWPKETRRHDEGRHDRDGRESREGHEGHDGHTR